MRRRWNATASRVSPNVWTGLVSPRMRVPAGINTCCPLWEYRAFVTRQLTGAAALPSRRFVRTVSTIVPSRIRWSGPAALIGSVCAGRAEAGGADWTGEGDVALAWLIGIAGART